MDAEAGLPHDEAACLGRVRAAVATPNDTAMAYLSESVRGFRRGAPGAATIMLGIASERVFLLLCDSLLAALADPRAQDAFARLINRFPMKPKLDWVLRKLQALQAIRVAGLPDNATLAVTGICDFHRTQRTDIAHPREQPPRFDRDEAFVNFQIFPRYYQSAEAARQFPATNRA